MRLPWVKKTESASKSNTAVNTFDLQGFLNSIWSTGDSLGNYGEQSMYDNDVIKACVNCNARYTSKAKIKVFNELDPSKVVIKRNKELELLIAYAPNKYNTGSEFLFKCRAIYDLLGNLFILIEKDVDGNIAALKPIRYVSATPLVNATGDLMGYQFECINEVTGTSETIKESIENLVIVYNNYAIKDYVGEMNNDLSRLQMNFNLIDEAYKKLIKMASDIRLILNKGQAILKPGDLKDQNAIITDSIRNGNGVLMLDSTTKAQPVQALSDSTMINYQSTNIKNRLYNRLGINDNILQGSYTQDEWTGYYNGTIQPFLLSLAQAMLVKIFKFDGIKKGNRILFESDTIQFATFENKVKFAGLMLDRGVVTPNIIADLFGLPHVEDGDSVHRRLDYANNNKQEDTTSNPVEDLSNETNISAGEEGNVNE